MHFNTAKNTGWTQVSFSTLACVQTTFHLLILTFSSSGSFLHVSVCGRVWPSSRSSSWLCESAHEPHGSPSSSSSHGGPGGIHAACGATQCARSEAKNNNDKKITFNFNSVNASSESGG